jgi:hypothetical protein
MTGEAFAQKVDLEKEKIALLEIHRTDRRAHFETDVNLLTQHSADEFIAVSDGRSAVRRAMM